MTVTKKRSRTPAQAAGEARYKAAHVRRVVLNLNDRTDADILEKLSSLDNMQGYIKACIRADLDK